MREVFDDEQVEPAEPRRDTELTMGFGSLFGLFACLVLLCALCFWLGYRVGYRGREPSPAATSQPATRAATGSSSAILASKPSASEQSTPASPSEAAGSEPQNLSPGQASPASVQLKQQPVQPAAQQTAQAPVQAASPVRPALTAGTAQPAALPAASTVKPALVSDAPLMVQIATLRSSDDAAVLIGALRKRGYEASMGRVQSDGLYHVRIGPFHSRDDAEAIEKKLFKDGYNEQIQP